MIVGDGVRENELLTGNGDQGEGCMNLRLWRN